MQSSKRSKRSSRWIRWYAGNLDFIILFVFVHNIILGGKRGHLNSPTTLVKMPQKHLYKTSMIDGILCNREVTILTAQNTKHNTFFLEIRCHPRMITPLVCVMCEITSTIAEPCLNRVVFYAISYLIYKLSGPVCLHIYCHNKTFVCIQPLFTHKPSSNSLRSTKRPKVERAPAFAGVPGILNEIGFYCFYTFLT